MDFLLQNSMYIQSFYTQPWILHKHYKSIHNIHVGVLLMYTYNQWFYHHLIHIILSNLLLFVEPNSLVKYPIMLYYYENHHHSISIKKFVYICFSDTLPESVPKTLEAISVGNLSLHITSFLNFPPLVLTTNNLPM